MKGYDRREFLAATTKLGALAAGVGATGVLVGEAHAATAKDKARFDLFTYAVRTKNMGDAIARYGRAAQLSREESLALRSVTTAELSVLHSVQNKLSVIPGKLCISGVPVVASGDDR